MLGVHFKSKSEIPGIGTAHNFHLNLKLQLAGKRLFRANPSHPWLKGLVQSPVFMLHRLPRPSTVTAYR